MQHKCQDVTSGSPREILMIDAKKIRSLNGEIPPPHATVLQVFPDAVSGEGRWLLVGWHSSESRQGL